MRQHLPQTFLSTAIHFAMLRLKHGGLMSNIYIERAIAIFGMCLWFVFPIGIFISVIKQSRQAKQPTLNTGMYHYHLDNEWAREDFEKDSDNDDNLNEDISNDDEKTRDDAFDDEVETHRFH